MDDDVSLENFQGSGAVASTGTDLLQIPTPRQGRVGAEVVWNAGAGVLELRTPRGATVSTQAIAANGIYALSAWADWPTLQVWGSSAGGGNASVSAYFKPTQEQP